MVNKIKTFSNLLKKMAFIALISPNFAFAAPGVGGVKGDDFVGISFYVINLALIGAAAFFFLETQRVAVKWKTTLTAAGVVPLVAAIHYFTMKEIWVSTNDTPTVLRYIDWFVTVPILCSQFYLMVSAIKKVSIAIFARLMVGILVMLLAGYAGEAGFVGVWPAFIVSMAGWGYVIYEIFVGEVSQIQTNSAMPALQSAFNLMRLIVVFGWAIYPIGYFVGYLTASGPVASMKALNVVYNLGDFINKIGFGLIIWNLAVNESEGGTVRKK